MNKNVKKHPILQCWKKERNPGSVLLSWSATRVHGIYSGWRPIIHSGFCGNPFSIFCVILLTNQQKKKMYMDENITSIAEVITHFKSTLLRVMCLSIAYSYTSVIPWQFTAATLAFHLCRPALNIFSKSPCEINKTYILKTHCLF